MAVFVALFPLAVVIGLVEVRHLAHSMNFVITPLSLVDDAVGKFLIAFALSVVIVPFADIVGAVRMDLPSEAMHAILLPLAFIQEAETVELHAVSMSSSVRITLAFVLNFIAESNSVALFSDYIVLYRLRRIYEVTQLQSSFDSFFIVLNTFLVTGQVSLNNRLSFNEQRC